MSDTTDTHTTDELTWWQRLLGLNPVVIAAAIAGVCGLLAALGLQQFADVDADGLAEGIIFVFGLIGSFIARKRVVPNQKVLAYLPDPTDTSVVAPGEATVPAASLPAVEIAAVSTPATEDEVYASSGLAEEGDVVEEDPFDSDFPRESDLSHTPNVDETTVFEGEADPGSEYEPVGEDQVKE